MARVRDAMAEMGRSPGQQEGEWKATILDMDRKASQERTEVSALKKVLANLEGKREHLRRQLRGRVTIWRKLSDGTVSWAGGAAAGRRELAALGIERRFEG
jgi:hypothetical protein